MQACNSAGHDVLKRLETKERAKERIKEMMADGSLVHPRGILNKQWRGGKAGYVERARLDGRTALRIRTYRRLNPHKVKEYSARRNGKMRRLPTGTILRIGKAQKWKCAICRVKLSKSYHHDHITPLARGGEHVPRNIQLLCGRCNGKKHAKDPIVYMQSLGRLL
jgi:5-methylcytosine-specific restriction endonuclease McrA